MAKYKPRPQPAPPLFRAMRRCTRCTISKPISEFASIQYHADGLHPVCNDCRKLFTTPTHVLYDVFRSSNLQAPIIIHPHPGTANADSSPQEELVGAYSPLHTALCTEPLTLEELGYLSDAIAHLLPELVPWTEG